VWWRLSVSTVSGYGLDDRVIEVRSSAGAKAFFPLTSVSRPTLGPPPASCTMGTGGPFPGAKSRPGHDADHSPHLVPRSRMSRSYTSSPPNVFVACSGTALAFKEALGQVFLRVQYHSTMALHIHISSGD
jgi:hypothetical protein